MNNDIAIVSYTFRFPEIINDETLLQLLLSKKTTFTTKPSNRKFEVPATGSFFKNPDTFDYSFFNLSLQEARCMDRQQRLVLELGWHCYEAGNIPLEKLQNSSTGVFIGSMLLNQQHSQTFEQGSERYLALGVSESILSNRLSYFLKLNGPSLTINTACSSSFAALQVAKEALLAKTCDYAFVGACNMIDHDLRYRSYKELGILSETLQNSAFSATNNGFLPGEGGVFILLTTRQKAIEENLKIHGVIKGCAINHTGSFSSMSLTAPSVKAQATVIQHALNEAGLTPQEIDYIECHGTGTLVGDPIELAALQRVYGNGTGAAYPIGSIKNNIGHLEACAGLASLIKALLMFKHNILLPTSSIESTNPLFDLISDKFEIVVEPKSFEKMPHKQRRIAISSFGFGGTNSHVILESNEDAYSEIHQSIDIPLYPFVISAKNKRSLELLKETWITFLSSRPFSVSELTSIASQLLQKPSFKYRLATTFQTQSELVENLKAKTNFTKSNKKKKSALHVDLSSQIKSYEDFQSYLHEIETLIKNGFKPDMCLVENEIDLIEFMEGHFDFPILTKKNLILPKYIKATYAQNLKPHFINDALSFKSEFLDHHAATSFSNHKKFHAVYEKWEHAIDSFYGKEQSQSKNILQIFALYCCYYSLIDYWNLLENVEKYKFLYEVFSLLQGGFIDQRDILEWISKDGDFTQKIIKHALFNYSSSLPDAFVRTEKAETISIEALGFDPFLIENFADFDLVTIGGDQGFVKHLFLEPFVFDTSKTTLSNYLNLWEKGFSINLESLFPIKTLNTVVLPPYPFVQTDLAESADQPTSTKLPELNSLQSLIQNTIATVLKIPPEKLDKTTHFVELGINSINIMQITHALSEIFGPLSATLLYEYITLADLCAYFEKENYRPHSKQSNGDQLRSTAEPIAIIGVSALLPGGDTLQKFWDLLSKGQSAITSIPSDRWNPQSYYSPDNKPGTSYTFFGGVLDDIKRFDALFFNISPREALQIDPQERLFLECSWKAIEDAGYQVSSIKTRNIGVFAGVTNGMYGWNDPNLWQKQPQANVSSAYWSVANRVSYCLNLTGPSLSVDTACSSSITAIHIAVQSLQQKECDYALAGASSLLIHPRQYVELCDLKMLSHGDKLKAFGKNADGFVYGEGTGVVFLKRLSDAIKDNDPIYAVICGSGIAATGKTSGYTVPSPNAQADVIQMALKKAAIDPSQISYVEAHGTGTALGDPIEIRGLIKAFGNTTKSCTIGSVKSNIGHLEAAAGMASLIKTILQLKHRQIVPSLNCEELNPKIDFENTSFSISTTLQKWGKHPKESLYAGISSFGAGGANAHLIVKSAPEPFDRIAKPGSNDYFLIVLSAKHDKALIQKAKDLSDFIHDNPQVDLGDVSYTLAIGREQFACRWAAVVTSLDKLQADLKAFIRENQNMCFIESDVPENLQDLANSFLSGATIGFEHLFPPHKKYSRIHLPTYPFQGMQYWITPNTDVKMKEFESFKEKNMATSSLFAITKTLYEDNKVIQCFTLAVNEFYFKEHILNGRYILPGVVHVEIARAAASSLMDQSVPFQFSKVTWIQPILGENDQTLEIQVHLTKRSDNHYLYKIMGQKGTILHSQGEISKTQTKANSTFSSKAINLYSHSLNKQQVYAVFRSLGWEHGLTLQTIESIYASPQNTGDAIAYLKLDAPDHISALASSYPNLLHPSIMDGILQSVISPSILNIGPNQKPALPFGFDSLEIYKNIPLEGWVHITRNSPETNIVQSHNLSFYDTQGDLCLLISGFKSRKENEKEDKKPKNLNYYHQTWVSQPYQPANKPQKTVIIGANESQTHLLLNLFAEVCFVDGVHHPLPFSQITNNSYQFDLCNFDQWRQFFQSRITLNQAPDAIIDFTDEENIWRNFERIFSFTKAAIHSRIKNLQIVAAGNNDLKNQYKTTFLAGFGKTLTREHPHFTLQVMLSDYSNSSPHFIELLERYWPSASHSKVFNITQEVLFEQKYSQLQLSRQPSSLKKQGSYIITGGFGGVGKELVRRLAKKYQASLVIASRSPIDEETQQSLYEFRQDKSEVAHVQCDVSKSEDVKRLLQFTVNRFGKIDGIFHAAGVLKDSLLYNKILENARKVFLPKVHGLINIHENLKTLGLYPELDFLVNFSSISAVLGNAGQTDYSCANAFMDAYSEYIKSSSPDNKTQIISIDWPYWKTGGMQVSDDIEKSMHERWGISALETEDGLYALETILSNQTSFSSILVAPNIKASFKNNLSIVESSAITKTVQKNSQTNNAISSDEKSLITKIKEIIKEIQHIDVDLINSFANLSEYGFDSISFTTLSNRLNETFSTQTTPAFFFEVTTVDEIAEFISKTAQMQDPAPSGSLQNENEGEHDPIAGQVQLSPQKIDVPSNFDPDLSGSKKAVTSHRTPNFSLTDRFPSETEHDDAVAIVGLSAQMPGTKTLEEFWQNMIDGKNVISEIPKSRWKWQDYFGDPTTGNKTNVKYGAFIPDYDKFDADFFGINGREATFMDPQHRLFLEHAWACIEDGGYTPETLSKSKTGLFVGVSTHDYLTILSQHPEVDVYTSTGSVHCLLPNRVSYYLNLTGPSESIDTACSSSLVAIHRAVTALQTRECNFALAGGVNALLHPIFYISFSKAGMLSEDGKCKTFDKDANGYVRGEGVGVVLLKRLSDSIRDGDHIYGIIRGSSVNHGGRTNTLTSPNPKAQSMLIQDAILRAKVDPRSISYIEAHGTGTPLGDPIEVNAIKSAFSETLKHYPPADEKSGPAKFCGIGSVKTHIGHLEPAAGIAGVIKVLLAFKHEVLPKNLNFNSLNPYINLDNTPFYIQTDQIPWQRKDTPRRAGVSSFGFGGVNGHLILEEYSPALSQEVQSKEPCLLTLSSKTSSSLTLKIQNLLGWVTQNKGKFTPQDLSFTLNIGRQPMPYRISFIFHDLQELQEKLSISKFSLVKDNKGPFKLPKRYIELRQSEDIEKDLLAAQEAFLAGYQIDWEHFYKDAHLKRLSLPTYPFERKRFWLEHQPVHKDGNRASTTTNTRSLLVSMWPYHPVMENHKINDVPTLPGVAIFSILNDFTPFLQDAYTVSSIIWFYSISYKSGSEIILEIEDSNPDSVHIDVLTQDKSQLLCEIELKKVINENTETDVTIPEEFSDYREQGDIYDDFAKKNINYGQDLRVLSSIQWNPSCALATINPKTKDLFESLSVFPFLVLEAGFQSLNVFSNSQQLPFRAGNFCSYGPLKKAHFSYAHKTENGYRLYFLNRSCKILATVDNLILKSSETPPPSPDSPLRINSNKKDNHETLSQSQETVSRELGLFAPFWSICTKNTSNPNLQDALILSDSHHTSLIESIKAAHSFTTLISINDRFEMKPEFADAIQGRIFSNIYIISPSNSTSLNGEQLRQYLYQFSNLIQIIISENPSLISTKLKLTLFTFDGCSIGPKEKPRYEASITQGFASVVEKEFENWSVHIVDLPLLEPSRDIIKLLECQNNLKVCAFRNHTLLVKKWYPFTWNHHENGFKQRGVYVIIGGAGGLGSSLAHYLRQHYNAVVIVLGRREKDQLPHHSIASTNGVSYIQADCSDADSLNKAFQIIKQNHSKIDGVIHSTLSLHDHPIVGITQDIINTVTMSKIDGTLNALNAISNDSLDFFMIFSSINSSLPQPGQAPYSGACHFQDSCQYLEYPFPIKIVNWGYWSEIGAVASQTYKDRFFKQGLLSINPAHAWENINLFITSSLSQIAYIPATQEYYRKSGIFEIAS